jgi:hypothetical protein
MQEITLKLTIEEANLILEGLGELPFKKVYALVNRIQQQASAQLGSNGQVAEESVAVEEETIK